MYIQINIQEEIGRRLGVPFSTHKPRGSTPAPANSRTPAADRLALSLKKQEKRKSITKAGRVRCSWCSLFDITHIVCTQWGATNIVLSIITDLCDAAFYFHSHVIKDSSSFSKINYNTYETEGRREVYRYFLRIYIYIEIIYFTKKLLAIITIAQTQISTILT